MKKNFILLTFLASLFIVGLMIYDFSDEIDKDITNKTWYGINDNKITTLNLANNKINYLYESNESVEGFNNCSSLHYNNNDKVTKFNCNGKTYKIVFAYYDDSTLSIKLNENIYTFYNLKKSAEIANMLKENNLEENQYQELLSMNLEDYQYTSVNLIKKYYNSKKDYLVAFINSDVNINNVLNIEAFNKLLTTTDKDVKVLDIKNLSNQSINILNDISAVFNQENYQDSIINIYKIGNNKVDLVKTIDINKMSEIDSINWE